MGIVYDAAGESDPEAAVTFTSDDPDRVSVEALRPRTALVRALDGRPATVRLRIRTQDAETYAWATVVDGGEDPTAVELRVAEPQTRRCTTVTP